MICERSQELKKNPTYFKAVIQKKVIDCTYLNFVPRCRAVKVGKGLYQKATYRWDKETKRFKRELSEEVFDMQKKADENGVMRNKRSLRMIFKNLRQLINTNFTDDESETQLFITLTYKENMQDDKKLHEDFRNFFKKLKRHMKTHELAYISIVEPQQRGAWHIHLLLKSLHQETLGAHTLYIPHEDIERLWGHGATRTERLQADNLGSYFIAYLSNAELSDEKIAAMEVAAEDIKVQDGKKYLKGMRLKWYPDYMQIYRNSRNITKPSVSNNHDNTVGDITYSNLKVIETEKKELEILTEQRRVWK
jgi:hypothetical protein